MLKNLIFPLIGATLFLTPSLATSKIDFHHLTVDSMEEVPSLLGQRGVTLSQETFIGVDYDETLGTCLCTLKTGRNTYVPLYFLASPDLIRTYNPIAKAAGLLLTPASQEGYKVLKDANLRTFSPFFYNTSYAPLESSSMSNFINQGRSQGALLKVISGRPYGEEKKLVLNHYGFMQEDYAYCPDKKMKTVQELLKNYACPFKTFIFIDNSLALLQDLKDGFQEALLSLDLYQTETPFTFISIHYRFFEMRYQGGINAQKLKEEYDSFIAYEESAEERRMASWNCTPVQSDEERPNEDDVDEDSSLSEETDDKDENILLSSREVERGDDAEESKNLINALLREAVDLQTPEEGNFDEKLLAA